MSPPNSLVDDPEHENTVKNNTNFTTNFKDKLKPYLQTIPYLLYLPYIITTVCIGVGGYCIYTSLNKENRNKEN